MIYRTCPPLNLYTVCCSKIEIVNDNPLVSGIEIEDRWDIRRNSIGSFHHHGRCKTKCASQSEWIRGRLFARHSKCTQVSLVYLASSSFLYCHHTRYILNECSPGFIFYSPMPRKRPSTGRNFGQENKAYIKQLQLQQRAKEEQRWLAEQEASRLFKLSRFEDVPSVIKTQSRVGLLCSEPCFALIFSSKLLGKVEASFITRFALCSARNRHDRNH